MPIAVGIETVRRCSISACKQGRWEGGRRMANITVSRRRFVALAFAPLAAIASRSAPQVLAGPAPNAEESERANTTASGYCPDSQEAKSLSHQQLPEKQRPLVSEAIAHTRGGSRAPQHRHGPQQ